MNIAVLEQLAKSNNRIFFQYNFSTQHFDFLSPAVERIWNLPIDEINANPQILLKNMKAEEIDALNNKLEKIKNGEAIEVNFQVQQQPNQVKILQTSAFPVRDENGAVAGVAGMAEDVTRQKDYEVYLVEYGRKKNSVLEIVAHDLRGPLAIVKSVASALERDHQERNYEELSNYVRITSDACDSCVELIGDILSEEHLQSPEIYVKKERIEVVERLRDMMNTYRRGHAVKQKLEVISEGPVVMETDPIKFGQIFNNLVSNSIKFTALEGRISIRVQQEGESVLFIHQDNGIGIPESLQPYIFDKYTKAAREGLLGEKPRGIGMSIVHDLVELQGGKIWLESKENEGTTFYIRLPKQD